MLNLSDKELWLLILLVRSGPSVGFPDAFSAHDVERLRHRLEAELARRNKEFAKQHNQRLGE